MANDRRTWAQRKPTQRALLGLTLIGVSVAGTTATIALNNQGTTTVVATRMITAGSSITRDDVVELRVNPPDALLEIRLDDVVGQRAAVDLLPGSTVVRAQFEPGRIVNSVIAIPLAISPAESVAPGARIQVWAMSADGLAPIRLVASDVVVVATRSPGFGGEVMMDVSLSFREAQAVLAAIGSNARLVVATGHGP
jgi:hypothetical protein